MNFGTKKKKEYSTILIIGKGQQKTQSIPIQTKHLERWKYYSIAIAGVFALLVVIIIYLSNGNKQKDAHNELLTKQIAQLKKQLPIATDTIAAKNYIQQIETKLKWVSNYLSNRGVRGFKKNNIGGNDNSSTGLTATETYKLYNEYLDKMLIEMSFTPLGYPHFSAKSSTYGYRKDPFSSGRVNFHTGIDLRGKYGDVVKSTANGKVILAGWFQGYGNCVRIKHANGYETLYGHLSKISVKSGQKVKAGEIVGKIGSTGHSTGYHLHYEVRLKGKPINPNKFLNLK